MRLSFGALDVVEDAVDTDHAEEAATALFDDDGVAVVLINQVKRFHQAGFRMEQRDVFGNEVVGNRLAATRVQASSITAAPVESEAVHDVANPANHKDSVGNAAFIKVDAIADGKKLIGTRYRYGGTSEKSGFDCSGLVQHVFAQQGYRLPRSSKEQFSKLLPVKEPRPGDLIFFRHGKGNVSHVGIYLGNQKMLHSPSPGKKVEITRIDQDYWKKRYAGARAVVQERVTVSR